MEKEKIERTETLNKVKEHKEYELTKQAKSKKFVAEAETRKFKKTTVTLLVIDIDGFKKECRLENDEKGLVVMNGSHKKYDAVLCDGVSQDGAPYLGIDILLDPDYHKREWFTRLEKVLLTRKGYLQEVK
jgi:hypothetical protein